ncbi:pyridine nucleotide-disulfide oxidoreductase domain-containing protein [Ditylenchus destructor]|nr:pyridine nucleotide-disulfide oxidoreductase domain-containing protein [Ditylenchus destructor]
MKDHFRLLVAGGGTAGCAIASKFSRILKAHEIAVVEPCSNHCYQPGLTFVGAGILKVDQIVRPEKDVLSRNVTWINESISAFKPNENSISLRSGEEISYDFLVIATGLELRYDMIKGLKVEYLSALDSGLCSIYDPKYARKVYEELRQLNPANESRNVIFTHPNTPIKCPGATQKICYLAEEYLRKTGKRSETRILYNTAMGTIFGVEKYARSLMKVVEERGIELNTRHNLVEVNAHNRVASFQLLDEFGKPTGRTKDLEYSLMHIAPPCSPVKALRHYAASQANLSLTDSNGWVAVHPQTLQCTAFPNIFAIGDCASTSNSKTAAAIASQFRTLKQNLSAAMDGRPISATYDGYASCPLIVDSKHVIMAEFNAEGPMETFPYDQSKPSRLSFLMKRYLMPVLYWNFLVKGLWNGPATFRKIFNAPSTIWQLFKLKKN